MRLILATVTALCSAGCGFHFAVGENPYGGPLVVRVKDMSGQEVGESLRRHLPGALARSGLTQGDGEARELRVTVQPWNRVSLYNTLETGTVVFGEQFTVTVSAVVAGHGRRVRVSETAVLAPRNDIEQRALHLRRLSETLGYALAFRLAEALE